MRLVPAAIDLIKRAESCRLTAYQDSGGVWTVGWGTTTGVAPGLTITQETADAWLERDLAMFSRAVESLVRVPLTSNQFSALVSFAYNVGIKALSGSTLLRKLNGGDYDGAREEFHRWVNDGGKRLAGLVKRRAAEAELFAR